MPQLLDGIRVVEVALYGFVPSAGAVLGDWGADVLKVEHPKNADPLRSVSAFGVNPGDGGVTVLWEVFNRGKREICIDIASPRGHDLLMALIEKADVFLTSFMQPTCARLGIDAERVLARNPRIIYGRGTGQGPEGPDANKGGFDGLSYWNRAGVSTAAMPPDYNFPISLAGPGFGDIQSGANLAGGVAAALYRREKTGAGGIIDVSLLGSGMWAMQAAVAGCYVTGRDNVVQLDRRKVPNPLTNYYQSGDGRHFALGMLEGDRYWAGLCNVLGRPALAEDKRFGSMALRAENAQACVKALDEIFAKMTMAEIAERLNSQEGQWGMVEYPRDTMKDEQVWANGYLQMVDYESGARLPLVPAPARLAGPAPQLSRAPAHGEHTDEILRELGCNAEEIRELKSANVIA